MLEEGIEFLFEPSQLPLSVKGGIEAEEGKNDVRLETGEPLIGGFEMPLGTGGGLKLFIDEFLGSREGILPVLPSSGMGSETRSVAFVAKVADGQIESRKAKVKFRLEMAVVNHSRAHARAYEGNTVPLLEFEGGMNIGGNGARKCKRDKDSEQLNDHDVIRLFL